MKDFLSCTKGVYEALHHKPPVKHGRIAETARDKNKQNIIKIHNKITENLCCVANEHYLPPTNTRKTSKLFK